MQTEIVLEDCPHCGGDAKFAGLADWPYLSNIVFCPKDVILLNGIVCILLF